MSDLQELIAQLEKATGPDRKLDKAIWRAMGRTAVPVIIPSYTSSLDAALTLVPEGSTWDLCFDEFMIACVGNGHNTAKGATSAIALCIAALKARSAP